MPDDSKKKSNDEKKAAKSKAMKKAAITRADNKLKKQRDSLDPKKVEKRIKESAAMEGTPEERKKAAREKKIAEIKKKAADEAEKKKAKKREGVKKANQTKLNVKLFKLVGKIRKASDDEAVKLLRDLIKK